MDVAIQHGTSAATSLIYGNGSAEFAAAVQIGNDPRNGTNTGTRLGTTTGLTATGDTATQYVVSLYSQRSNLKNSRNSSRRHRRVCWATFTLELKEVMMLTMHDLPVLKEPL